MSKSRLAVTTTVVMATVARGTKPLVTTMLIHTALMQATTKKPMMARFFLSRKNISAMRGVYRVAASWTTIDTTVMAMPSTATTTWAKLPRAFCSVSASRSTSNRQAPRCAAAGARRPKNATSSSQKTAKRTNEIASRMPMPAGKRGRHLGGAAEIAGAPPTVLLCG